MTLAPPFSATDGIWELFDETSTQFLLAIEDRQRLDSIVVVGTLHGKDKFGVVELRLTFDKDSASLSSQLHPDRETWLKHFILNLKDHILPPSFLQRITWMAKNEKLLSGLALGVTSVVFLAPAVILRYPYCRILVKSEGPSQLLANVKANLLSNLIWAILGAVVLFFVQWIAREYHFTLNGQGIP